MVSLQRFLIGAVPILTYRCIRVLYKLKSCICVRMATKLYKYSSDQGRLNSFEHLSKQSTQINTFNIFSKVDRNHTLPKIVWTVVSTNCKFYNGSLRINVLLRTLFYIKLGNE